jgi:hypothetical protein
MSDSNRGDGDQALASQSNDASAEQKSARGDKQALNGNGGNITPLGEQSPSQPEPANTQNQAKTEQPEPHVLSDLIAQQEMADASIMMGWAAIGTLVITAIGTLFLAWQVKLTREAVKDTGEATDAMQRQNEISEAAQRPWITFEVEVSELSILQDRLILNYRVTAKNIGKTAAIELKYERRNLKVEDPKKDAEDWFKSQDFSEEGGLTLMPSDTYGKSAKTITKLVSDDGPRVDSQHYICISARYRATKGGQELKTEFAFIVGVERGNGSFFDGSFITADLADKDYTKECKVTRTLLGQIT